MKNPFLKSLRPVWQNPHYVFVSEKQIKSIARKLSLEDFEAPAWDEPIFPKSPHLFMKFILVANSINFCFTDPYTKEKFRLNYEGKLWRGSMAMVAALKKALDEGVPLFNTNYLLNMTKKDAEKIFRYNRRLGETPIPFLNWRLAALTEVGESLRRWFNGDFLEFYKASEFRAFNNGRGLAEMLIKYFPFFNDTSIYQPVGEILHFHKRAQLLAMVYQGRALSDLCWPFPLLEDADDLGPPADYAVPVALEDMGILVYSQGLKDKIMAGEIIDKDSPQEQEIRAQTIYAMIELLKEINKLFKLRKEKKISVIHLDYKIWQMGRNIKKPHHLTPTMAY